VKEAARIKLLEYGIDRADVDDDDIRMDVGLNADRTGFYRIFIDGRRLSAE
jgi:hypothetical protein